MSAEKLITALEALSKALSTHAHEGPYHALHGWQGVPLNREDLRYMADLVQSKVETVDWSKVGGSIDRHLAGFAAQVTWLTGNVPNLASGHMAPTGIVDTLLSIDMQLAGMADEDSIRGTLAVPSKLHRHANAASKRLAELQESLPFLEQKVAAINSAHTAAEKLDITLADLEDALKQIRLSKENAAAFAASAQAFRDDLLRDLKKLREHGDWAAGIRKQVGETYVASTNAGLASAFSAKARTLAWSVWGWMIALIVALGYAAYVGHLRFPAVLAAVGLRPDWGVVLINVMLSTLSLAPAIWLGWVATKQIGQRFRLSEDYAYKAALSMAYEGYRSEAAKVDPAMQARLFGSALSRLDELPLRLVEKEVHATPTTELFKSETVGKSIDELKSMRDWLSGLIDKVTPSKKRDANKDAE